MATTGDKASASSPSPLDALARRVATLEREREMLMERYSRQLEFDNEQLRARLGRGPSTEAIPSCGAIPETAAEVPAPTSAAMLARVLSEVESQADDVERLVAAGQMTTAMEIARQATLRSAAALRAAKADAELRETLVTSMTRHDSSELLPPIQNYAITVGNERVPFRVAEIAVLQMAGLRRPLAEKHVDTATFEYEQLPPPNRTPVDLREMLDRIEAVESAITHAATVLPFVMNQPPQRLKWRKLVTFGLGGTLIVAANAGAVVILGPIAAAVSAAVGSAAIGAAAAPLVM